MDNIAYYVVGVIGVALIPSIFIVYHTNKNKRKEEIQAAMSELWTELKDVREKSESRDNALEGRVLELEVTMIRENDVKEIVNESVKPLVDAVHEMKSTVDAINENVIEIKIQEAERRGREMAEQESQKNK